MKDTLLKNVNLFSFHALTMLAHFPHKTCQPLGSNSIIKAGSTE
jgi:hypothetical protein